MFNSIAEFIYMYISLFYWLSHQNSAIKKTSYYKVVDNQIIYKMVFTEYKLDVFSLRYEHSAIEKII